ncbi:GNAT family N-acetyltransferase [Aestuariimicrobium sp. Y1814]|uniref:GNAT family N-acetyltransferase n=1 Tax=Aestuariimicrobium sp. Y1814 TaxID=3418742 RepID=UPI003DA762D7
MPTPFIVLVDAPPTAADGTPGEPGAIADLLERYTRSANQVWFDVFGHGDFADFPHKIMFRLNFQKYRRTRVVCALDREVSGLGTSPEGFPLVLPETQLDDTQVVGGTEVSLEFTDNPHLLDEVELWVDRQWRRRGVGTLVQSSLEELARQWGCTTVGGFSTHTGAQTGELVMPAEGPFGVPVDDAATRFAQGHGYHLAQSERHSVQTLPDDPATLGRPQVADGYELVTWAGPIDPALAPDVGKLLTDFEATTPMGDIDYNPQVITADRVLDSDRERHRHQDSLSVAVRHLASGDLAGLTQLITTPELPEPVWQGVTVVAPEHRGHGLGMAIKLEAVHGARARWPRSKRVHTWNAGENDYMWAINEQLGYLTAGVAGAWQKKLG